MKQRGCLPCGCIRGGALTGATAGQIGMVSPDSLALFLGNVNDALLGILYVPLALVAVVFLVKRSSELDAGKTQTDEAVT